MVFRTAVVIGASLGGLLVARALTDAYDQVIVVDRDRLPERAVNRRGVPQGRQLHVLLVRGRQALEDLLPGVGVELTALGVPTIDLHDQVHWYNDGYRMRRAPSSLGAYGLSRPLLEQVVRRRVAALPGVTLTAECEAVGLTTTGDRRRVTGVRLRERDGTERTVRADLTVDAGGRGSRSPVWLAELGYRPAAEEQVQVDVTYVTRVYRREPHQLEGLLGALTNAIPGQSRGGIVAPQEQDRFAVAISGVLGEEPPTDDAGMLAFARSLPAPQIAELLRSAQPLGAPAKMRFPASVRRRYERLRRFPAGYLVVADALCSFNPVYGQGITVAALEAQVLRRLLHLGPDRLARRFFRQAARVIDGPWAISSGSDLRFPAVSGPRPARVRLVNAYLPRLHAAATRDPTLGAAFLRVLNLVDPPARLLAPTVLLRVLRAAVAGARHRRHRATDGGAPTGPGQRPSTTSIAR